MKTTIAAFLLLSPIALYSTTASAKSYDCPFLQGLAPFQEDIAYQAYRAGNPYNIGLTTVAIAWEESKLGLYKVRFGKGKDVSVGTMHSAVYWKTKGMSAFERGIWVESMITNNAKAIQVGVDDLLMWRDVADGDYRGMINGYNAGYGSNSKYVQRVVGYVRELEKCKF